VKLHIVNKEKPTKKLVGRKRKTTEEKSEEHYPITTRGSGICSVLGNLIESWAEMRPFDRAFSTSFFVMAEVTQLVAAFDFPLAIVFLVARCFTRIYQS
jgi:hypothetical protein